MKIGTKSGVGGRRGKKKSNSLMSDDVEEEVLLRNTGQHQDGKVEVAETPSLRSYWNCLAENANYRTFLNGCGSYAFMDRVCGEKHHIGWLCEGVSVEAIRYHESSLETFSYI